MTRTLNTTTGAKAEGQTLTIARTDAHGEQVRFTGLVFLAEGFAYLRLSGRHDGASITLGGLHTPFPYI